MIGDGSWSKIRRERGVLIEYSMVSVPLIFAFEFNPATISRSRRLTIHANKAKSLPGSADFDNQSETQRVAQGASLEAETLTFRVLLDSTDRMNHGDPVAGMLGVQPEIDTLMSMMEPKEQAPAGVQRLAKIAAGDEKAVLHQRVPSVLVLKWGPHIMPVFMTDLSVDIKDYLPSLYPYRAEASITLELIEGQNPLCQIERMRQAVSAASHIGFLSKLTDWMGV